MKSVLVLLVAGATSVSALLPAYAQCGGLSSWLYEWQCEAGLICSPVGTNAFPNYQCLPSVGPIIPHVFPWAQCGGEGFTGGTLCPPYWTCVKNNQWFSTCVKDVDYVTPLNTTPDIASPGDFCGQSAIDRGQTPNCAPGYICTGPGVFGYFVCLLDKTVTPPVATTSATPVITSALASTLVTTTKSTTTKKTTTAKTTKKTTTSKLPASTAA